MVPGLSMWQEALAGVEMLLLHATPVYYGIDVPRGDGSGVVLIPGFLANDVYLMEMYAWLKRIGYQPFYSGIGFNADCPNLLIGRLFNETVDKARRETGRKIHLIGHSPAASSPVGCGEPRAGSRFRHYSGLAVSGNRDAPSREPAGRTRP